MSTLKIGLMLLGLFGSLYDWRQCKSTRAQKGHIVRLSWSIANLKSQIAEVVWAHKGSKAHQARKGTEINGHSVIPIEDQDTSASGRASNMGRASITTTQCILLVNCSILPKSLRLAHRRYINMLVEGSTAPVASASSEPAISGETLISSEPPDRLVAASSWASTPLIRDTGTDDASMPQTS